MKSDAARGTGGSVSLREHCYNQIKRRIIFSELTSGQYLNTNMLAQMLGVGRTPIHEALLQLSLEGLVEVIPRKGVVVRPLSLQEALEINEIRALNESYCASLAAVRASKEELDKMRGVLKENHLAVKEHDIERALRLDRKFHSCILRASRNLVLVSILKSLHERSQRYWFLSLSDHVHLSHVLDDHEAIFDALVRRNPDMAREATEKHIKEFGKKIAEKL